MRRLRPFPALHDFLPRLQLDRLRAGIAAPTTIQKDAAPPGASSERLVDHRPHTGGATATLSGRPSNPHLAAVVLNYDTPDETRLAVRSLQSSFVRPDSIIVVDNGSPNGSAALKRMLAQRSAREPEPAGVDPERAAAAAAPCVIETGRNLGFSGGMNVGIRAALDRGAELVLLVNSDASLAPDATRCCSRPPASIPMPASWGRW